jgi:hypothetical protein
MADGEFTTWTELYEQLLNDLASRSFRTMQSYSMAAGGTAGSRTVTYRGLTELRQLMDWVKSEAMKEQFGAVGRVYMTNGGRD